MSGRVVSADTEFVCPIQHGRECCKWLKASFEVRC